MLLFKRKNLKTQQPRFLKMSPDSPNCVSLSIFFLLAPLNGESWLSASSVWLWVQPHWWGWGLDATIGDWWVKLDRKKLQQELSKNVFLMQTTTILDKSACDMSAVFRTEQYFYSQLIKLKPNLVFDCLTSVTEHYTCMIYAIESYSTMLSIT